MATKMSGFKVFKGTKDVFISSGKAAMNADAIVFITGGGDVTKSCVYAQGTYFANFTEFLSTVNYVKGINVGGTNYNAAIGGGYIALTAKDPTTIALNVGQNGVEISLSETFVSKVNNTATALGDVNDAATKDGSAFARIAALSETISSLTGEETGSINDKITAAIENLDLNNTYEAKGESAKAETAAKAYADSLAENYDAAGTAANFNSAMDERVKILEAIDHEKLASDASAAAVATVLDGAPEKFNTLKEIANWIAEADTAEDAASLVTRVATLESIDHNAYINADAQILSDAKSYVDSKVDGKFDTSGAAATALTEAKSYADSLATNYDIAGAANTAKSEAINSANANTTEVLKSYYTKTEVDNMWMWEEL